MLHTTSPSFPIDYPSCLLLSCVSGSCQPGHQTCWSSATLLKDTSCASSSDWEHFTFVSQSTLLYDDILLVYQFACFYLHTSSMYDIFHLHIGNPMYATIKPQFYYQPKHYLNRFVKVTNPSPLHPSFSVTVAQLSKSSWSDAHLQFHILEGKLCFTSSSSVRLQSPAFYFPILS